MKEHLRIAAVADLHVKKSGQASLQPMFATKGDMPVYNLAMPLLAAHDEDRQPFRVIEVPVAEPAFA